ncbi:MAG TPA: cysteine desulfurase family protein [Thermoanaerobaculia bacterium]|nr:cysteine desulfurase family protein [Thermoanaerobaculia bacterium]
MTDRVYADHHATTPLVPEAFEAMRPWLTSFAGNPSSTHADGRAARRALEDARESVAKGVGAEAEEVVFTSGGTEADALAVVGGARAARSRDPRRTRVLYGAAEHAAVRESARSLLGEGFEVRELPVDSNGLPRREALDEALNEETALVSLILASNETGVVDERLPESAEIARRHGVLFHTDAVQAVGKIPVDMRALGADLLSFTGHKLGGPRGAGALVVRKGVRVEPLLRGGGQEKGRRAGTENVAAIAGLSAALSRARRNLDEEGRRLSRLRDAFEAGLASRVPDVAVNGAGARRLPTASSAVFRGAEGETLLQALDLAGISASSGSACASGTTTPSRVLLALGLPVQDVKSTLRFSFGWSTTSEEMERVLEVLPGLVARVRSALALR